MHNYEIRILNDEFNVRAIVQQIFANDPSAIRRAKEMAGDRPVEVWRGMTCVLQADRSSVMTVFSPDRPAA